ncbi:MAG TPA: diguanylate cyclase, partial [Thermoanaerobaculia bacterium]|nr:diguanylate cyclase [Thermoanaerobaculia bacterium]
GIVCTLSAGVAVYPDHAGDLHALLAAADLALYAAKAAGHDRVVVAT